jgi:hypothetical protein
MARPSSCEFSSSCSSRRPGVVGKIGTYYFFALLTFALFSIGTASWVDEHASKEMNPTEAGLRKNHGNSARAFVFDEKKIDEEIIKHVTVLFTQRESAEFFSKGLQKVRDFYPPGIKFIIVTCGNDIDRTQLKQELLIFTDLNVTYLEVEDEYVSITVLRKMGMLHVKTDYILHVNFDTHAWVTKGEDPLDWLRILFDVAQHADDSFGVFAPALVNKLLPGDPEHEWMGHGPPSAGNIATHMPLKASSDGNWVRDIKAVLRLNATVLEDLEDHCFLVRVQYAPYLLNYTEKSSISECSSYEVDMFPYYRLPKDVFILHVPWSHVVFEVPQTYISWRSLPYYGYIRGEDCTMQEVFRIQGELAASIPVYKFKRGWALEFTDALFMQQCDWGRIESPFFVQRETSNNSGGLLPQARNTQLKILISVLSLFRYNVFKINDAPFRYVDAQLQLDAMAMGEKKVVTLSALRVYDFPKCQNHIAMESDKSIPCFETYTPVIVIVATVDSTSRPGLSAYSPCLHEMLGQHAFLISEADGDKNNNRKNKSVTSKQQQQFFHVTAPGAWRIKAANDLFTNFTKLWTKANVRSTSSSASLSIGKLWSFYKKKPLEHKVCQKTSLTKTEKAFPLHLQVHVCMTGLIDGCLLDMGLSESWTLEHVRHSRIHGGESILNRFLIDKYKLHKYAGNIYKTNNAALSS